MTHLHSHRFFTTYIFFSLLLFHCTSFAKIEPANTTGSITGYVIDSESKEPLIRVAVSVKGTKLGTYTNKNGFYTIKNIVSGKAKIQLSSVGYAKQIKEIEIKEGGIKVNISLQKAAMETEQVRVEAEREVEKEKFQ